MSEEVKPKEPIQNIGLQCKIEISRYPSGERVGLFLSTILPFDFFILNERTYAETLNNFIINECRNYTEAVTTQAKTGYKEWPLLQTLFDQLSKSQVKPTPEETPPNENQTGEEWQS